MTSLLLPPLEAIVLRDSGRDVRQSTRLVGPFSKVLNCFFQILYADADRLVSG